MALAGAPATTAIVASLPREKQGVASAVNDVSRELGGALGIAVLGSLLNSAYRSGVADATTSLPPDAARHATSSLAAAQQVGAQLGAQGQQLVAHAQAAFMDGFSQSLVAGAAALAAGRGVRRAAGSRPGRVEAERPGTGGRRGRGDVALTRVTGGWPG